MPASGSRVALGFEARAETSEGDLDALLDVRAMTAPREVGQGG